MKSKISMFVVLVLLPILGLSSPAAATTTTIYPLCGDTIGDGVSGPSEGEDPDLPVHPLPRDATAGAGDTLTLGWDVQCAEHYVASVPPAVLGGPNPITHAINIGTSGASGNPVTFDLNGHRIAGPTVVDLNEVPEDQAGIRIEDRRYVTVTDSTAVLNSTAGWVSTNAVTLFDAGIDISNSSTSTQSSTCPGDTAGHIIEKLNIVDNVGVDGDYGEGIQVMDSDGNIIRGNNLSGNGQYGSITLFEESDCNVVGEAPLVGGGNIIVGTVGPLQGIGIRLEAQFENLAPYQCTDRNKVQYNTVTGSPVDGIAILNGRCDSVFNEISHNIVNTSVLNGIRLNAGAAVVRNTAVSANIVTDNGGAGIKVVFGSINNTISGNTSLGNNPLVVDDGASTSPLTPPHGDLHDNNLNCDNNTWTGNTHVTEYARPGSATNPTSPSLPIDFTCIN